MVWLVEASAKVVGDGKLLNPTTWFGKGSWFTNDLHFPFAWLKETAATAADAAAGASTGAVELLQKQLMPQQQPVVQQHPVQLKQQNLPLNSVFHTLMVMNQWQSSTKYLAG